MSSSDELRLRRATREDIAFLANLQNEMNTQPHLCQADPRFWVIVDYRYRPAARLEDVDRVCIYSDDGSYEYLTTSELRKAAYEDAFKLGGEEYGKDWLDEYNLYREYRDEDEFSIEEDYGADLEKVCEYYAGSRCANWSFDVRERFIAPNTMFLTLREATAHLRSNYYHYDKEAHPYAMTACRSPEVERLYKILHEVDFRHLLEVVDDD